LDKLSLVEPLEVMAQLQQSALSDNRQELLPIEAVQKALNRSRASIYRYANTHIDYLNPPYDPKRLNPELRINKDDPLLFHPNEVARFARDILGIKQVTIQVQAPVETVTQELLRSILTELQHIRQLLSSH
jgi:hypothetical protein